MPRVLFEKMGAAVWMSHLDLMRLFQRAFKRAGLNLKHTQGYNPRPSVSIALPLSVGMESRCELLDFDLEGQTVENAELVQRLNSALVDGIRVLDAYDSGSKIRDLGLLRVTLTLEYDGGIPQNAQSVIAALFAQNSLEVEKKGKNGVQEQNIIPMIRSVALHPISPKELQMEAVICCQNPTLNPNQLLAAISRYLPALVPDHARIRREEIFDTNGNIFR